MLYFPSSFQLLDRDILYFPCSHHIYEIIIRATFEVNYLVTFGSDILIFKRFQQFWQKVNINDLNTGLEDIIVNEKLNDITNDNMLIFYMDQSRTPHNGYYYRKLLELAVIFLGGISFQWPGAMHLLKIFIFRQQLKLTKNEEYSFCTICLFLIRLFVY